MSFSRFLFICCLSFVLALESLQNESVKDFVCIHCPDLDSYCHLVNSTGPETSAVAIPSS